MPTDITVYKDGKTYYIPTSLMGYDGMFEINGSIIPNPNTPYITTSAVISIRPARLDKIPVSYQYGEDVIPIALYDARIEQLKRFKEKIDEKYDEDGDKQNVCIWTDKDAEKEFYVLTNKYHPVYKPEYTFGEYLRISVVNIPKSKSPFIVPDWKVSNEIVLTCTFTRKAMVSQTVKNFIKANPHLKIADYSDNYTACVYINDTKYELHGLGNITRGTLNECIDAEAKIHTEIKKWFMIESKKTEKKSVNDIGSVLAEVKAAIDSFQYIRPKVATKRYYDSTFKKLAALKDSLESELINS